MLGHYQHHALNYQGKYLGSYDQFKFLEFFKKRKLAVNIILFPLIQNVIKI